MEDLLARCLDGDPEARDRFVDRHAPVVYSTVQRVVRARVRNDLSVTVEDITQEVFLKLFGKDAHLLRSYDPARASLTTWLVIIARSVALDALRRRRPPTVPLDMAEHVAAPEERPRAPHPLAQVPSHLLSPRQKLVMQLLYDRGLEVRDIARILGIVEQTVRSARHKALTKLRAFFADTGEREKGGDVRRRPAVERIGGEGR